MTYENFEHKADIGVRGIGNSVEEAFEEAGKALFSVMVDIAAVKPSNGIKIECGASNVEELFVEWLNALLAEADIYGMMFSEFKIEEIKNNKIIGSARGEKLSKERHSPKIEVKAATYSGLKVVEENGKWVAECIVDV